MTAVQPKYAALFQTTEYMQKQQFAVIAIVLVPVHALFDLAKKPFSIIIFALQQHKQI